MDISILSCFIRSSNIKDTPETQKSTPYISNLKGESRVVYGTDISSTRERDNTSRAVDHAALPVI